MALIPEQRRQRQVNLRVRDQPSQHRPCLINKCFNPSMKWLKLLLLNLELDFQSFLI